MRFLKLIEKRNDERVKPLSPPSRFDEHLENDIPPGLQRLYRQWWLWGISAIGMALAGAANAQNTETADRGSLSIFVFALVLALISLVLFLTRRRR